MSTDKSPAPEISDDAPQCETCGQYLGESGKCPEDHRAILAAPSSSKLETLFMSDINYWYQHHNGVCPYCGINMRDFPPEANIFNHFNGFCGREAAPKPAESEREKFEKWSGFEWGLAVKDFERNACDSYLDDELEMAWLGWQASIAARTTSSPELPRQLEKAEAVIEYVRRHHNSRSDELMRLIAEYDATPSSGEDK